MPEDPVLRAVSDAFDRGLPPGSSAPLKDPIQFQFRGRQYTLDAWHLKRGSPRQLQAGIIAYRSQAFGARRIAMPRDHFNSLTSGVSWPDGIPEFVILTVHNSSLMRVVDIDAWLHYKNKTIGWVKIDKNSGTSPLGPGPSAWPSYPGPSGPPSGPGPSAWPSYPGPSGFLSGPGPSAWPSYPGPSGLLSGPGPLTCLDPWSVTGADIIKGARSCGVRYASSLKTSGFDSKGRPYVGRPRIYWCHVSDQVYRFVQVYTKDKLEHRKYVGAWFKGDECVAAGLNGADKGNVYPGDISDYKSDSSTIKEISIYVEPGPVDVFDAMLRFYDRQSLVNNRPGRGKIATVRVMGNLKIHASGTGQSRVVSVTGTSGGIDYVASLELQWSASNARWDMTSGSLDPYIPGPSAKSGPGPSTTGPSPSGPSSLPATTLLARGIPGFNDDDGYYHLIKGSMQQTGIAFEVDGETAFLVRTNDAFLATLSPALPGHFNMCKVGSNAGGVPMRVRIQDENTFTVSSPINDFVFTFEEGSGWALTDLRVTGLNQPFHPGLVLRQHRCPVPVLGAINIVQLGIGTLDQRAAVIHQDPTNANGLGTWDTYSTIALFSQDLGIVSLRLSNVTMASATLVAVKSSSTGQPIEIASVQLAA